MFLVEEKKPYKCSCMPVMTGAKCVLWTQRPILVTRFPIMPTLLRSGGAHSVLVPTLLEFEVLVDVAKQPCVPPV